MNKRSVVIHAALLALAGSGGATRAAGLKVHTLILDPGTVGTVVVSGHIEGEATIGYTIQLEIISRAGNIGSVTFTPAPPTDIVQVGDPWPMMGLFSPFDTDTAGTIWLNGCVDDNGTFLPTETTYSGVLAEFPVQAGGDAFGVWDVLLTTSAGASSWEGLSTAFEHGIIVVELGTCDTSLDCDDADVCTDEICVDGLCEYSLNNSPCEDGLACTANDQCVEGACVGKLPVICTDDDECTINGCADGPQGFVCTCEPVCQLYADVFPPSGSCAVDLDDILLVIRGFAAPASFPAADIIPCGGNGIVDLDDLLAVLQAFAGNRLCPDPCPAEVDACKP